MEAFHILNRDKGGLPTWLFFVPEKKYSRPTEKIGDIKSILKELIKDRNLIVYLFGLLFFFVGFNSLRAIINYYIEIVMEYDKTYITYASAVLFGVSAIFFYPVNIVSKKFGYRKIMLYSLIVLIIFGILLWIALTKPFGGPVYVQACVNGKYGDKVKKQKARGRIKLSAFNLPSTGMNYSKAYFQATGEPHIFLKTKTPVYYSGRAVTEVRIESGAETTVSLDKEGSKLLYIRYESRLRAKRKGPKPPKGPKEPKRPGGGFGGGMGGGSSRSGKRPGPSRPGTGPAPSRPGSAPSGTGPSKPGSRPGTGPAPSRPGSAPSGTGPSRPGSRPGAGPAPSRPGSAPSGTGPSKPGSRPGAGPAPSRPGSRPTAGPGVRPSARPGSRPGSRPSPRRDKE